MTVHEVVEKLRSSDTFKEWKTQHESSYLAHAFLMFDANVKNEWQIGFYNPEHDTVTSFIMGENIIVNPESEVFKKKKSVTKLDLEKVKVSLKDALAKASDLQKEQYKQYTPIKKIVILQHIDKGLVWNISFVTASFNTLNIKIDAESGDIVDHALIDFFSGLR